MHHLRIAHPLGRQLARLVLVWFALSIGAAVASPLVNPQNTLLICSGGAMKVLVTNADGSVETTSHKLDCPLCATVGAPPPDVPLLVPPFARLTHVLQPIVAARIAALVGAPLPARGPPVFS